MEKRQAGIIIMISSVLLITLLAALFGVSHVSQQEACLLSHDWPSVLSHVAIGIIFGLFSLGVYLIFFSPAEKAILSQLEEQKNKTLKEDKFALLSRGLSEEEKKVLSAVREQEGITQHTLGLRTDMHKSKLSLVLKGLEQKSLVVKRQKGKNNLVYSRLGF